jgi:uncharacterized cupin superfamily protein
LKLIGVQLSRVLGLKRTAVSIARMPPGKESFVYQPLTLTVLSFEALR